MSATSTVVIVDDDFACADALAALVAAMGHRTQVFPGVEEFLSNFDPALPGCLLLDVRMPLTGGLALQEHLAGLPLAPPVVMMTGHAEVATALRAMRQGAVAFLEKPCGEAQLYEAIQQALARDAKNRAEYARQASLAARFARLKSPEVQVLKLVLQGLPNKSIAAALGISRRTVEDRRAKVMQKLQVESLADLVRVAMAGGGENILAV